MSDFTTFQEKMQEAKKQNARLAAALKRLQDPRADAVAACSREIHARYCADCGQVESTSLTCKHRLCPICMQTRSHKIAAQAEAARQHMTDQGKIPEGAKWLLVTLTQKNVKGEHLSGELDRLLGALTRIRHLREIRRYMLGSARNVEITYNRQRSDYHPHVHLIAILDPNSPTSISTARWWRTAWQKLMGLHYEPICDVREIDDPAGATMEVSKYVYKPASVLTEAMPTKVFDEVVSRLCEATAGRRLVSYTGEWRAARQALKMKDEPDLDEAQPSAQTCRKCGSTNLYNAVLVWTGTFYQEKKREE